MASDAIVTSRMVLRALTQAKRRRGHHVLEQLEQQEPELAEHVMDQLSELHHRLWAAGLSDRQARVLYRQVQQLVLSTIVALRQAHAEAWERLADAPESPAANDDAPPRDDATDTDETSIT